MCISALPGDVVKDCMHMYVLCPPGKPGVQLIFTTYTNECNISIYACMIMSSDEVCSIIFITVGIIMNNDFN